MLLFLEINFVDIMGLIGRMATAEEFIVSKVGIVV